MDVSDLSGQAGPVSPDPDPDPGPVTPRRWPAMVLTVFLGLLSVGVIAVMRLSENRFGSPYHAAFHWQALERSLLVQSVFETEPPAVRWLSGSFSPRSFYGEQNALALAAERDGYLSAHARQAMALVAHRAGDFEKKAYWRDGPPDHLPGPRLLPENREAIQRWQPADRPGLMEIAGYSGSTRSVKEARQFYWENVVTVSILLGLGILLMPSGRAAGRLLLGKDQTPVCHGGPVIGLWEPGKLLGGWLRATWLFAFGGIALTACYYLAAATYSVWSPSQGGSWRASVAETFLRYYSRLFAGWGGVILGVGLAVLPVYLMGRKFAGGLRGMGRIFGLAAPGMRWTRLFQLGAGGAWIAVMVMVLISPVLLRLGWFDSRDAWRFEGGPLPLAIFYGCVMAPLLEEIVFRGFLFSAFANCWQAPTAAVLSSLIFAGVHGYSWSGFLMVMAYGLLFCALFRRTGSLWPGMITHGLINLMLMVISINSGS